MKTSSTLRPTHNTFFNRFGAKLLTNFSWLLVGKTGTLVIGFVATLYLARVLGPQGFGQIAFAQAILIYFILLSDFGLKTLGTREIAAAHDDRRLIVGKVLTIRIVLVIISLPIMLCCAPILTPSSPTAYLVALFSLCLIPEGLNLIWFFRGIEQMMTVAVSEILQVGSYLVLLLILVNGNDQLFLVPIIFLAGCVASTIYLSGIYIWRWRLPRFSASKHDNWIFFRSAVPMALTLFLHQMYYNLDTLMLGFFRGEREVGLYNAAYRIILGIISINMVFMQSVYPTFSRLYRETPTETSKLLKETLSLSMLFAIPIGIGGTIMARPVIVALFGPSFADATFAFQILIWSASLAFLGANYGYCLVACQQQKALAIAATIGTSTNILLNFMLIPPLGILGACLATIIAQIVMLFCEATAFISRVSRTLPSTSITLKASVAGVAMGFGIICLNGIINWPGQILFGIVVYFLILWILGGIPLHALLSFRRS